MPLTTAYAGHADTTTENAGSILDQFLPKDPPDGIGLGLVFIPERVPRVQKGLKTTITWLENELGGPEATIPVPDLIEAMLKRQADEGDDLELYLLFDPKNEDDVALANAAHEAGIPVRDLAGAGDFLVFEESEAEGPPFEPDAPVTALENDQAGLPTEAAIEKMVIGHGVQLTLNLSAEAIAAIAQAIVAEMAKVGAESVAAASNGQPPKGLDLPLKRDDHPAEPVGRTETFPGAVAIYYNADKATYRKARGMARDGEAKIYMTEDEAKAALALPAPQAR